ncbi:MAG: FtsX-like permease family protein [Pseudomonadota bacterium]
MSDLILWAALAWRNVLRNFRRSLLTLAIVAVASTALLSALGFILASFEGVKYSIVHGGAGHLQIARGDEFKNAENRPLEFGSSQAEVAAIGASLARNGHLRKMLPRLAFQGLISNGENTHTFSGEGMLPDAEWQAFGSSYRILSGDYLDGGPEEAYTILLGKQLAARLHAKVGDNLTVVVATTSGQMNAVDVTLKGIVSTGIAARDGFFLAMPLAGAQDLLRTKKISRMTVLMKTADLSGEDAAQFQAALPPGFQMRSWRELNPIYDQLVTLYRGQFIVLGTILLVVAFLSILNTIIMNVMERTREIGTLRALGIDAGKIRLGFIFESMYICGAGALLGALLAKLLSMGAARFVFLMPAPPGSTTGYPLQLLWNTEYAVVCCLALTMVGIVAAWFASRYVSRLNVVDAINSH